MPDRDVNQPTSIARAGQAPVDAVTSGDCLYGSVRRHWA